MQSSLEYLADTLTIEALTKNDSITSFAQEGNIVGSVAQGVKDYVSSQFDKDKPISSITAFLGSGLLWSMGFKWMSVLYTVAEALGFDWKNFWSSVGSNVAGFVKNILSSNQKPSEDQLSSYVNSTVQDSFNNSFTGEIDKDRLLDIAKRRKLSQEIRNALEIRALAIKIKNNPRLIKHAGILNLFRGKLATFFIRTISWLVKTALISLGFVSAAGAISTLLGKKPGTLEETTDLQTSTKLQISPNIPQEMFTVHPNNMSNVWIEKAEVEDIENLLKSWIISVYPQLQDKLSDLENSSSFQSVVNKFRDRNRLAAGLDMISVPRPYQRKVDVVAAIISEFLKEHPISQQTTAKNYL